jgi:hypothetical protein
MSIARLRNYALLAIDIPAVKAEHPRPTEPSEAFYEP